ncbi:haloacid dehalogenase [Mariannaea sp. PMI_226]|nr:haloacid dehalogenase [Mariannaea sp. PMI_226]
MSSAAISPLASVKALTFDVFGTTVDWRTSVINEIKQHIDQKLNTDVAKEGSPSAELRERIHHLNYKNGGNPEASDGWIRSFADAWRQSYVSFVHQQARAGLQDSGSFKTTDEHLYDSLIQLLDEWLLKGLFIPSELKSLSLVWHRLAPWSDTVDGLAKLAAPPLGLVTATLTNGNIELIHNLNKFGDLGFQRLFCAELLKSYKPAPETYLSAARELGLQPSEVAMVAAHMSDLAAARNVGLRTVYVARKEEEWWSADDERLEQAKDWVDIWIKEDEGGFVELTKRLTELRA